MVWSPTGLWSRIHAEDHFRVNYLGCRFQVAWRCLSPCNAFLQNWYHVSCPQTVSSRVSVIPLWSWNVALPIDALDE